MCSSETDRQSQTDKLRDRQEQPGGLRQKDRYRAERRTDKQAETDKVTDRQIG